MRSLALSIYNFGNMKTILILAVMLLPSLSLACPLGAGETELTISRVMRNFGRGLMPSERLLQKALMGTEIPDAELDNGIAQIAVVLSCADAAIGDRVGNVWPRKAHDLQGAAREAYLALYRSRLNEFRVAVVDFREELARQRALPAAQRDFRASKEKDVALNDAANRAHETLN